ncbi:hypothetical protein CBR_g26152 [Chara braunii]|uniref:Fungal lipase-type domain-containing protein n=1 Tax=Chara braunii TaxID=69332 RepID=A0A388JVZ6_CHABU|nr:hypothetical protein CBR_g26152 [Chara braunii]|eukprot:GBG61989.1 hypothetical protein CBR_g26152 [Chara braunii]
MSVSAQSTDSEDFSVLPSRVKLRKDGVKIKPSAKSSRPTGTASLQRATPSSKIEKIPPPSVPERLPCPRSAPPMGDGYKTGSASEPESPVMTTVKTPGSTIPADRSSSSRDAQLLTKSNGVGTVSERISVFSKKDTYQFRKDNFTHKRDVSSTSKRENSSSTGSRDVVPILKKDSPAPRTDGCLSDGDAGSYTTGPIHSVYEKQDYGDFEEAEEETIGGRGGGGGGGSTSVAGERNGANVDSIVTQLDRPVSRVPPRLTSPVLQLKARMGRSTHTGLWSLIGELKDNRLETFIILLMGLAFSTVTKAFAIMGQIFRLLPLPQWLERIWERAEPRGPLMLLTNGINPDFSLPESIVRWFPDPSTETPINAQVIAMAAKLSFEELETVRQVVTDNWKMEWVRGYFFQRQGLQVFIFRCRDALVVIFRVADLLNPLEWMIEGHVSMYHFDPVWDVPAQTDRSSLGWMNRDVINRLMDLPREKKLSFLPPAAPQTLKELGQDLDAVWRTYERTPYDLVKKEVVEILRMDVRCRLFVGGHGIGAGCAAVFTGLLIADDSHQRLIKRIGGLYTFGQPRVGCGKFANFLERLNTRKDGMLRYLRFVNNNDVMARMPPATKGMYQHGGSVVHLVKGGDMMVLTEQPRLQMFKVLKDNLWTFVERLVEVPWFMGREGISQTLFRMIWCYVPAAFSDHFMSEYQATINELCEPICL